MAVVNLDRLAGKVRNRVFRVGVELEGGWKQVPAGINLQRDGSIALPNSRDLVGAPQLAIGELPSEPMEVIKVKPWMKKYYPSHVNATCGLHVHMSFSDALYYQRLMVPDYQDTVIAYLSRWATEEGIPKKHCVWKRLAGESEFCKLQYFADEQAQQKTKNYNHNGHGNRYTAVNYCFGQHETIEVRVLPMFEEPELGIKGVHKIIEVTNLMLVAMAKKEEKVKGEVVVACGDETYREERREYI